MISDEQAPADGGDGSDNSDSTSLLGFSETSSLLALAVVASSFIIDGALLHRPSRNRADALFDRGSRL